MDSYVYKVKIAWILWK